MVPSLPLYGPTATEVLPLKQSYKVATRTQDSFSAERRRMHLAYYLKKAVVLYIELHKSTFLSTRQTLSERRHDFHQVVLLQ